MGYWFTRVDRNVQATHAAACPSGGAFRYQRLCLVLLRSIPPENCQFILCVNDPSAAIDTNQVLRNVPAKARYEKTRHIKTRYGGPLCC